MLTFGLLKQDDVTKTRKQITMKTRIIYLVCLMAVSTILCQEGTAQTLSKHKNRSRTDIYASITGQVMIPLGEFQDVSKVRGGFGIEFGKPLRKVPAMSWGVSLSGILSTPKKEKYKGMEVKSTSGMYDIHPFIRWTSKKANICKPFADFSFGLTMASTETTSSIVYYPTFLEQVLFGQETEVETVSYKDVTSSGLSYGVGAGIIIKDIVMIGVRFQHTNPVDYIDKDKVYVRNNAIQYDVKRIRLDRIEVTIGISNWGSHKHE